MSLIPLARREGLPSPSGGFVLAVGSETVTAEEIVTDRLVKAYRGSAQANSFTAFREDVRSEVKQLIISKVSDMLLYNQSRREIGENVDEVLESEVQKRVREFIVSFGGDYAEAEHALDDMGMDWDSYREYQKRNILSRWYLASQYPQEKPISHSEMVARYEQLKDDYFRTPASIRIRLIDIRPGELDVSDSNLSANEAALKLAEELLDRIKGGEDFGALAKKYSHGHRAAYRGLWKAIEPDSLAKPYDKLADVTKNMKVDHVAGPLEAGEHIFIVKLEERKLEQVQSFAEVQDEVEAQIYIERRREAIREFTNELVSQAAAGRLDDFVDFCVQKIYVICNRNSA